MRTERTTQTQAGLPTPIPSLILEIEKRLKAEIEAIHKQTQLAEEASARWSGTSVRSEITSGTYALRETVRSVAAWTIKMSERLLSKPGAPAKCDAEPWLQAHLVDDDKCIAFSPTELWEYLRDSYAPERVEEEARARAAEAIHDAFQLWRSDEVKRVGGRVRIDINMYSEKRFGSNERRYSYNAQEQFRHLVQAIEVFASTQSINLSAYDLIGLGEHLNRTVSYDFSFSSGDRHDLYGGISVTAFNSGLKVFLPMEVANHLNVFITLYRKPR